MQYVLYETGQQNRSSRKKGKIIEERCIWRIRRRIKKNEDKIQKKNLMKVNKKKEKRNKSGKKRQLKKNK
jgi:hypothetical protein